MDDAGLLLLMISDPLAMNMSNTLGYFRGELGKERGKRKENFGKRVLEVGFIKKILLAVISGMDSTVTVTSRIAYNRRSADASSAV